MSEEKSHIELADSSEWPEALRRRLDYLSEVAENNDFSILCIVGLNHESKHMSVIFSPKSSSNPHLIEMVDDMAEMFSLMAKRLKQ